MGSYQKIKENVNLIQKLQNTVAFIQSCKFILGI